jgi:TatD DNase family protein
MSTDVVISGWVDTHCHVHDAKFTGTDGVTAAVTAAQESGVTTMISVGCDRLTSLAAIAVAEAHNGVHASVGLHPHDASHGTDSIADLVHTPGIVAIGEAGLDYYYEHSPRDVQRRVFGEQIDLAHEHGLPLVIHTRDAWDDTFAVLTAHGVPTNTIFHCFTGGPVELERALDLGAWISFSGIVSFANATEVRAAAERCPMDRMLLETDSPYLAPVPHRGKTNQPAWVAAVGVTVADLKGLGIEHVAAETAASARRAFPVLAR